MPHRQGLLRPMRDRLLEWLVGLFARLPLRGASGLGAALGGLMYRFGTREVRNARINLALCFPQLDAARREAMVKSNLAHTGRSLAEMVRLWGGPGRDWSPYLDNNGFIEAGRALVARGKGLIIALPHMGNWELIAYQVTRIAPTTALYRPPRQAFMDRLARSGRARSGISPVPIDRHGLKALHAALQSGEAIAILPDQVPKGGGAAGVVAPFFGQPALTMTLVSRLARRHGSPVLFCYAVYEAEIGRHRIHYFEGEAAIGDACLEVAAAALNRGIERCVRASPAHYQWTYRRFQIPGQPERNPYREV